MVSLGVGTVKRAEKDRVPAAGEELGEPAVAARPEFPGKAGGKATGQASHHWGRVNKGTGGVE